MYLPNLSATARAISFSLYLLPWHPGSLPPCPASITITLTPKAGLIFEENALAIKQLKKSSDILIIFLM